MNFFEELKNYDAEVASACFDELTRQHIGNIVRNRLGDGANIPMGGDGYDDDLQYDDGTDDDFGGYLPGEMY